MKKYLLLPIILFLAACANQLPRFSSIVIPDTESLKCRAAVLAGIDAVEQKYNAYVNLSDGTRYGRLTGWYIGPNGVSAFGPSKSGVTDAQGNEWTDARAQRVRETSLKPKAICETIDNWKGG